MLELKNIGKQFNQKWLFKNLNLTVQSGDFISILGPSGCGKSTLLRIMAGLETVTCGQIESAFNNAPGFVFQESCLLPWLSVFENVAIGLQNNKLTKLEKEKLIVKTLDIVKLSGWKNRYPHELSGGMKMRVSIARALVNKPNTHSVLFLDEPFAALDDFTRFELQEELLEYWQQHRMTVFFVTHSVSESVFLSQKLWLFPQGTNLEFCQLILNSGTNKPNDFRSSDAYFKAVTEISHILRTRK